MVVGEIVVNGNVKGVVFKIGIVFYKVFNGDDCELSWVINVII